MCHNVASYTSHIHTYLCTLYIHVHYTHVYVYMYIIDIYIYIYIFCILLSHEQLALVRLPPCTHSEVVVGAKSIRVRVATRAPQCNCVGLAKAFMNRCHPRLRDCHNIKTHKCYATVAIP